MKVLFGTIASVIAAMGTYLAIIALITLRVYHLSITQNLEVSKAMPSPFSALRARSAS